MKRWYRLITFLVIAIFLYMAGMVRESVIMLALGGLIESAFWIMLFRRKVKIKE